MTDYKPYTIEWTRKRYLSESLQTYFDNNVSVDIILSDIIDVLEENIHESENRAEKFKEVLKGLKSFSS